MRSRYVSAVPLRHCKNCTQCSSSTTFSRVLFISHEKLPGFRRRNIGPLQVTHSEDVGRDARLCTTERRDVEIVYKLYKTADVGINLTMRRILSGIVAVEKEEVLYILKRY